MDVTLACELAWGLHVHHCLQTCSWAEGMNNTEQIVKSPGSTFFFLENRPKASQNVSPWRLAAQDSGGGSVWQCQVYGSVCHCQVCSYFLAWPGRAWPSPLYCSEVAFSRDRRLLGSGVTAGHCQPGGEGQAGDIMDVTLACEEDP